MVAQMNTPTVRGDEDRAKENEDDEPETAIGFLYTHFDCPYCSEAQEAESDIKGETVECEFCKREFVIR